ncbi:hypothetical protein BS50DRAFT_510334 [Corynespora cassiicola Philippines]|uniref:RBR-type E3 ubiquitin transferase n=1 Tax=Corynespora cassiicola Philippines TaxID=1448308 RepID=A0A2T2P831_CORCC|nr:hypothetical protein BS50DRAFT_510334 [Corynespora cassiicola Philippines]
MSATILSVQSRHPSYLDDEIVALSLQLEELKYRQETSKGKWNNNNVPDLEVAYANYLTEMEHHFAFLKDVKLAHSIANAVNTDGEAIAEIFQLETQAQEDHRLAVQLSTDDPNLEAPPPYTEKNPDKIVEDEVLQLLTNIMRSNDGLYDDPNPSQAGPSMTYAERQTNVLGKLASDTHECIGCSETFRFIDFFELECRHKYCGACLKRVIMRAVAEKDLAWLPPRCCGTSIPNASIIRLLDQEELNDFQDAQVEKETSNKTYCSNPNCCRFILPQHIVAGEATCSNCQTKTCSMCKNASHEDDCPADPNLQATLSLGAQRGWQRCFSCRTLVEINLGCNHMTCKCGAQFCYLCGTRWREGACAF